MTKAGIHAKHSVGCAEVSVSLTRNTILLLFPSQDTRLKGPPKGQSAVHEGAKAVLTA